MNGRPKTFLRNMVILMFMLDRRGSLQSKPLLDLRRNMDWNIGDDVIDVNHWPQHFFCSECSTYGISHHCRRDCGRCLYACYPHCLCYRLHLYQVLASVYLMIIETACLIYANNEFLLVLCKSLTLAVMQEVVAYFWFILRSSCRITNLLEIFIRCFLVESTLRLIFRQCMQNHYQYIGDQDNVQPYSYSNRPPTAPDLQLTSIYGKVYGIEVVRFCNLKFVCKHAFFCKHAFRLSINLYFIWISRLNNIIDQFMHYHNSFTVWNILQAFKFTHRLFFLHQCFGACLCWESLDGQ